MSTDPSELSAELIRKHHIFREKWLIKACEGFLPEEQFGVLVEAYEAGDGEKLKAVLDENGLSACGFEDDKLNIGLMRDGEVLVKSDLKMSDIIASG